MDETRVHPTSSPPSVDGNDSPYSKYKGERNQLAIADDNESINSESYLLKPRPVPGSYVIKVPKDQIYRVPPPENAKLFQSYCRRGTHPRRCSSPCCRCLLWTLAVLFVVVLVLAVTVAILYFVFHPKLPSYTLDSLSIKGFNVSLTDNPILSPEFDVTVRADNPNKKIGLYYRDGSDISVSYSNVHLCSGVWPTFYQGARNVTVFRTALKGSGIRLSTESVKGLKLQEDRGEVPLEIDVKVPVRVKFGLAKSWTMKVKVKCDVVVDTLTASSRIVSKSCKTKVDL